MHNEILALNRRYTDDEARANLRSFISTQDRATPPVFVGREEIIEALVSDVSECGKNLDEYRCFTRVIYGAPGAGKTSLVGEIRHRLSGEKGAVGPLTIVSMEWHELSNKVSVASAFISAHSGRPLGFREERTTTTTKWLGSKRTGLERQTAFSVNAIEQQIRLTGSVWTPILENTSIERERDVFLLLVDESQNIAGDRPDGTGKNEVVANLHAGFAGTQGLKVVPVFAGLSDTESVLAERGILRLPRASSIHLGSLSTEETQNMVDGWMRYEAYGFENLFSDIDIRRVSKMIAVSSEGWPRHANGYLTELARSILEKGVGNDLTVDLNEVFERGHDDRRVYYQKRLRTAKLGGYASAIRDAAQRSNDGIVELATLREIAEEDYGVPRSEADYLHDKAIHAGVLEHASYDDEEHFKFPIPSFFTYMHLGRDPAKFNAKMREQLDAHSHLWG